MTGKLIKARENALFKSIAAREKALAKLLEPIEWNMGSSVRSRQALVTARQREVALVMPFLTDPEKAQARAWQKKEAHEGLWD